MNGKNFFELFDRRVELCRAMMVGKGREYSTEDDKLHNFKAAAAALGTTPEAALMGMAIKHFISLVDEVKRGGDPKPRAFYDEKIGDMVNYLILLEAVFVERHPAEIEVGGEI